MVRTLSAARTFTASFFSCLLAALTLASATASADPTPIFTGPQPLAEDYACASPPIGFGASSAIRGRTLLVQIAAYYAPPCDTATLGRIGIYKLEPEVDNYEIYTRTGSLDALPGQGIFGGVALDTPTTAAIGVGEGVGFYEEHHGVWQQVSLIESDTPNVSFTGPLVYRDGVLAIGARALDPTNSILEPLQIFLYSVGAHGRARHVATVTPDQAGCMGTSFTLSRDKLVIGVPCAFGGTGKVLVFNQDGNRWTQRATLVPGDPQVGSGFGTSVAIRNGIVAVGSPYGDHVHVDETGDGRGSGYVFRLQGHQWRQIQKVQPAYEVEGLVGAFGTAAAITRDRVAFSAPEGTSGRRSDNAQVDIYKWQGRHLVFDQMIVANQNIGEYMLASGRLLLIAQPGDPYGQEGIEVVDFDPPGSGSSSAAAPAPEADATAGTDED